MSLEDELQNQIIQQLTKKNNVYPNIIYNLSSLLEPEIQGLTRQLEKPDFIKKYDQPIQVQSVQCTTLLFSFQPFMKRVYQNYKTFIIYEQKFLCNNFEDDVKSLDKDIQINYNDYKRGVFVFPQQIGQKLNAFVSDCAFFKSTNLKNVMFIDLEMYDRYEISEIGLVVMDLEQNKLVHTFCTLVAREDYSKDINKQSAYFVYKNISGIPFLHQDMFSLAKNNMLPLSEVQKQIRAIDQQYKIELFLAKGIMCEKQHIDQLFNRKCNIKEVYPLIYIKTNNFDFLNVKRSEDDLQHRCKFHQQVFKSKRGEYHCALQDVYMYAQLIAKQ